MKVQSAFLATAMAFAMISVACSSSPGGGQSSGAGGTSNTGAGGTSSTGKAGTSGGSNGGSGGSNGGSGGTASCPNGTACGGSVVGSWTVGSSCLTLDTSNVDITLAGLDPTSCTNVSLSGSLTVTGTWSSKADGTYTDGTTTSGTAQLQLPAGCLRLSGTTTTCARIAGPLSGLGFASATCTDAAGGGCSCTATIDQMGGIGFLTSDPQTSGNYATAGSTLTADTVAPYSYCVAGTQLTLTPQPTNLLTTGTIVLHGAGSTGTGGTTGTTGIAGTTGTTGTAGTNGAAGTKGTAGTSAPGGTTGTAGTTGAGGSTTVGQRPCDIYAAAGQSCAAAYSMIRTLRMGYTGALYQVRSGSSAMNTGSGGTTKDILQTSDGFADTSAQDTFCSGTTCTVSLLYDQSGNGNNLKVAPGGTTSGGTYSSMPDFESSANKDALTISGHKVYALYMNAREGYRLTAVGKGMPTGAKAQGIYELADGTHSGSACCWDFGDVSTDPTVYTTMNTIFFGTGFWGSGAGAGPWFMGDFEGGVWAGSAASTPGPNTSDPSMKFQFAFGIVKTNPPTSYAIRAANGNLPTATALTTAYSGAGPKTWNNSGGILLGIGSDNSNNSFGTFYEGAITNGQPSDATDLSVMQNVQAAGYGK